MKKSDHKYPLVKVTWVDITADSAWKELNELEKETLPICVSIGFLYKRDKK